MSTMSTNAGSTEAEIGPDDAVISPPPVPRSGDQIEAAPVWAGRRAGAKTLIGAVVILVGLFMVWGGIAPLTESRDDDRYHRSDPLTLDRASSAVVTTDVELLRGRGETLAEESFAQMFMKTPDDIRMRGVASGDDAVFLGIAPTSAVNQYLDGVAYDEITEWEADQADILGVEYTSYEGTVSPAPPDGEPFWVVSVSGMESQTLDWTMSAQARRAR